MIELRPFSSLGAANHGWLDAHHHFSFADYHDPARVTEQEYVITVSVVHLSQLLARADSSASSAELKQILAQLRVPDYPVWRLLQQRGVKLPMDVPELVDTLAEIAHTSGWISHQLLGQAQ